MPSEIVQLNAMVLKASGGLSKLLRRVGPVAFLLLLLLRQELALYACRSAVNSRGRRLMSGANLFADPETPVIFETIENHEVMYQAPAGGVMGVLFVAHGCHHAAGDFFLKSETCPTCLGLPEERRLLLRALHRGYAVVAVSSLDRASGCWNSHQVDRDLQPVATILDEVRRREGWADKPLYALGASSGGSFVLCLPLVADLRGISPQIMGLGEQHLRYVLQHMGDKLLPKPQQQAGEGAQAQQQEPELTEEEARALRPYPPALFQHMARDRLTANVVAQNIQMLLDRNVSVKEVAVDAQPLEPTFLSDRIIGFPEDLSRQIASTLKAHGLIGVGGHLKRDPRSTVHDWQWLIREHVPALNEDVWPLQPDASAIHEELNIAYASHEIISDHIDEMLDWFERQGQVKR